MAACLLYSKICLWRRLRHQCHLHIYIPIYIRVYWHEIEVYTSLDFVAFMQEPMSQKKFQRSAATQSFIPVMGKVIRERYCTQAKVNKRRGWGSVIVLTSHHVTIYCGPMTSQIVSETKVIIFFEKWAIRGLFFSLFSSFFCKQLTVNKCSIKVADDWIRTRVLWYRKRSLCQLRHNYCPSR